jgi:uncharacterized protein (TIGR02118 family)
MAKLLAMYKHPTDPAAFDKYYATIHAPLAKKIPGLRNFKVSTGGVSTPAGDSSFHQIAILGFDSKAALLAGLGTPEGQATVADLANFAQAGVDVLIFDTQDA